MESKINKVIFTGRVINNVDPMMLGRLRIVPESQAEQDMLRSVSEKCAIFDSAQTPIDIKEECKWTLSDPFLFLPLLPYHINTIPEVNELVTIIYPVVQDATKPYTQYTSNSQYYIQGPYSSPMLTSFEHYTSAKAYTSQGDLVKKSLSIRNQDGTYKDKRSYGIFPEPGDNSLMGRGTSDIIVKKNDVIIRAGKTNTLRPDKFPLPADNRSFLQLSKFEFKRSVVNTGDILIKFEKKTKNVQKLVEWHIENLENTQDSFTGYINVYNVKPNGQKTNTDNFDVNTVVDTSVRLPQSCDFAAKSSEEVINIINSVVKGVNSGLVLLPPPAKISPPILDQFPFFFRPSARTYAKIKNYSENLSPNRDIEFQNATKIFNAIKLKQSDTQSGFGLVSQKNSLGPFLVPVIESLKENKIESSPVTYGILGGQKLYLLSQDSSIPSKGAIDFSKTIYGFTQDDIISKNVEGKTSSMVRGEELLELMTLIIKFMLGHVHPFPGMPPVPVAQDGTQSAEILQKMLDATNTILNTNIRLN
jgi:hypothetical protein